MRTSQPLGCDRVEDVKPSTKYGSLEELSRGRGKVKFPCPWVEGLALTKNGEKSDSPKQMGSCPAQGKEQ